MAAPTKTGKAAKIGRGKTAYLSGLAAEARIKALYLENGYAMAAERWRGGGGEIDLIFRKAALCIFVEVKKSSNFDKAAHSLSAAQIQKIMASATAFVAGEPMGQLTDMRFDVALVDAFGATQILENALFLD